MNFIKKSIKLLSNHLGYDVHKINSSSDKSINLFKGLKTCKIDLILDVGANIGQFSRWVRNDVGYAGRIISFEPIAEAHKVLSEAASSDREWVIHKRCAIGDVDGEVSINISKNLVSSSILPITELHTDTDKSSAYIRAEKTPLFKLDTICQDIDIEGKKVLLKIDTQGFESQVLNGAKKTLSLVDGVIIELSPITLYEGQELWIEIIRKIEESGFRLWSISNGFTDNNTGQALQVDATFFKNNKE